MRVPLSKKQTHPRRTKAMSKNTKNVAAKMSRAAMKQREDQKKKERRAKQTAQRKEKDVSAKAKIKKLKARVVLVEGAYAQAVHGMIASLGMLRAGHPDHAQAMLEKYMEHCSVPEEAIAVATTVAFQEFGVPGEEQTAHPVVGELSALTPKKTVKKLIVSVGEDDEGENDTDPG